MPERIYINPKWYLGQYKQNMHEIHDLDDEIEQLETHMTSVSVPTDKVVVKGGKPQDFSGTIAKIADMQVEVKLLRAEAVDKLAEIDAVLAQVEDGEHAHILRLRYISCLTFEQIAVEAHYSYRWVCTLHGRALQEVGRIINGND